MNAAVILVVSIILLVCGYLFYGRWLAKTWGVDESKSTPSHDMEDGIDYVPAKSPVLMGHHFSSIAGAGPINGPIQAAVFGWVPVFLWVVVGGIFFGAVHDFGALFASIRHKGQSIGEVIADTMGAKSKKLFIVFAYLTLLLVVAAFTSIVASTFAVTPEMTEAAANANASTAMISLLFILLAIAFGFAVYRRNAPVGISTVLGIAGIIIIVAIGLNWHPITLSATVWMIILGFYILVASVTPVWILLQPRDYLSSFLLYFMIIVAFIGIIGAAFTGNASLDIPAFTGFTAANGNGLFAKGTLFPALFITIACGAISGFHSLVSSGTTAKQIDNERDALPIGFGAMLIECVVAIVALCAVGYVWNTVSSTDPEALKAAGLAAPTAVFAKGISQMIGTFVGAESQIVTVSYSMLVLAVSVFCLTSLDTATRLARYMFQEFWLEPGQSAEDVTGYKKVLVNPYVSTIITVILGVALGMTGFAKIWPLFGAANQLLAALGLLAVATWLGKIGKKNKMFFIPMAFMLFVTITSLCFTLKTNLTNIMGGTEVGWSIIRFVISALLVILAIILAIDGIKTLKNQLKKSAKA